MPLTRTHVQAFEEQVEILATMDVGKLWDRVLGAFLAEWERLHRQQLSAEEMGRAMQAFLDGLSDRRDVEDLARTGSSVSYNQGRGAAISSAAASGEPVEFVVRSEVLDSNTCEACANLDSAVFDVGTSDYYEYMPPAKCLGGDRCRGFYVAMSGGPTA